jgi:hypothetical protein
MSRQLVDAGPHRRVPIAAKEPPAFGLYFRRYAPFETFGGGFQGDGRDGPSTWEGATSRTYGIVLFNRLGIITRFGSPPGLFAGTSGTHYHSTVWGDIVGHATISATLVDHRLAGAGQVGFSASTAGANPLVPKSPDLDTFVVARLDFSDPKFMEISGEAFGDDFPNLEVYVKCYTSDHAALLLDGRTTGGRNTGPATRLFGSHANQSLGKLKGVLVLTEDGTLERDYVTSATTM